MPKQKKNAADLEGLGYSKVSPNGHSVQVWEKWVNGSKVDELLRLEANDEIYDLPDGDDLLEGSAVGLRTLSEQIELRLQFDALIDKLAEKMILLPPEAAALKLGGPRSIRAKGREK